MIYVAIIGWLFAIAGWWGAWNVFQNLRIFVQVAAERERKLIQERLIMIENLQAAFDAAAKAVERQTPQVPNAKGSGTTLN